MVILAAGYFGESRLGFDVRYFQVISRDGRTGGQTGGGAVRALNIIVLVLVCAFGYLM